MPWYFEHSVVHCRLASRGHAHDNTVDDPESDMPPKPNPLTRGKKQKALALLQHNQPGEALPLLEQVCRTDRRDTEAWFLLAAAHQELGNIAQAADAYRQVIALDPCHIDAHFYLGNTCLTLGDGPGAVAAFRETVRLQPDYRQAHVNLGALLELQHNYAAAEKSFREALRLEPRDAELHYNLGNVLQAQDRFEEAVAAYRQALTLRSNHADTCNNLGNALARLERHDEAIASYEQALRINPGLAAAHNNMGNTLVRMHRIEDALAEYEQALRIAPDYAAALTNLGNTLQRQLGKIDEGIAYHRRAIACDPNYADAHHNLAFCLLLKGEFREGWREYDWRWKREGGMRRPLPPTPWEGLDLNGRSVFIHAEQGIGDEIFFLRFVPQLKQRGTGQIAYRSTRKIASLLKRISAIDRLAAPDERPTSSDAVFSVGDLPAFLGIESATQAPPSLTLAPLASMRDSIRQELAMLGPPPYIGVTWRAGVKGNDLLLYKESPLEYLARLLRDIPGTVLVLQRHPAEGEIAAFSGALGRTAHDFSALNDDLDAMLALLALIDDYIGVSNTNMHLRAAVGKTARVLVPTPPEWRWMAEGQESPWFPGFTVYRQGYDGGWEGALEELLRDLHRTFGS